MNIRLWSGVLFVILTILPVLLAFSQKKTALDYLKNIPPPPKTVDDAVKRCPKDTDTATQPSLDAIESAGMKEAQDRTSGMANDPSKAMEMVNSMQTMNQQEMMGSMQFQQEDRKTITSIADSEKACFDDIAQQRDDMMKKIEAARTATIDKCPMVNYGEGGQDHDQKCVAAANAKAKADRLAAENNFLAQSAIRWSRYLAFATTYLADRDKKIHAILDGSTNPYIKMQYGGLLGSEWTNVGSLYQFCRDITKEAAQYGK